jgi:hypothetical protein
MWTNQTLGKRLRKRFDIRFLFADEKEALLQNWAIDADMKELEEKAEEPEAEMPMGF